MNLRIRLLLLALIGSTCVDGAGDKKPGGKSKSGNKAGEKSAEKKPLSIEELKAEFQAVCMANHDSVSWDILARSGKMVNLLKEEKLIQSNTIDVFDMTQYVANVINDANRAISIATNVSILQTAYDKYKQSVYTSSKDPSLDEKSMKNAAKGGNTLGQYSGAGKESLSVQELKKRVAEICNTLYDSMNWNALDRVAYVVEKLESGGLLTSTPDVFQMNLDFVATIDNLKPAIEALEARDDNKIKLQKVYDNYAKYEQSIKNQDCRQLFQNPPKSSRKSSGNAKSSSKDSSKKSKTDTKS